MPELTWTDGELTITLIGIAVAWSIAAWFIMFGGKNS